MVSVVLYNGEKYVGHGSGFYVQEGLVATNYHVIKGFTAGYIKFIDEETGYPFSVAMTDESHDLALLKVDELRYPLKFANLRASQIGDQVYAVGSPFFLNLDGSFTIGNISQIKDIKLGKMLPKSRWIIHSAPISAGSSGGPLLNEEGKVIGVTSASIEHSKNRLGQNINLAISAYYLQALIKKYTQELPLQTTKRMASQGDPASNYVMAMESLKEGKCESVTKHLEIAAKAGYQKAQNRIGILKYSGKCYTKDVQAAKAIFVGAIQHNPECSNETLKSSYMLANIIFYDEGDAVKALKVYEYISGAGGTEYECRAQKDNEIQSYSAYMAGYILEQTYDSPSASFTRYEKAAKLGYNKAQYKLGVLYARGIGIAPDLEQARYWLNKSADNGYAQAETELKRYGLVY
jgi:TPR repeat protein